MVTFAEWLKGQGLTVAGYARRRGFHHETVRRHALPPSDPDFRLPKRVPYLIAYYLDSDGQVDANSFYELPELPKAEAA